jgi:hypothetical protein
LEVPFAQNHKTPTSEPATFPLTYRDSVLDYIHRQLIEKMFHLIPLAHARGLPDDVKKAYMAQLATELASRAVHAVLFFKHEAYSNEREYRFLEMRSWRKARLSSSRRKRGIQEGLNTFYCYKT